MSEPMDGVDRPASLALWTVNWGCHPQAISPDVCQSIHCKIENGHEMSPCNQKSSDQ